MLIVTWCEGGIRSRADSFPVWADDSIAIQKHREMLIGRERSLEHGNGNLGLTGDVLELGECLADGHLARVRSVGVVRPVEQDADVIGYGRVLAEDAIDGRVARRGVKGLQHLRPKPGTKANQPCAVG